MMRQSVLARIIGVSQLALGMGILVIPDLFFNAFGFSAASPDQKYLFGQLAARFLAYGVGMFFIARNPIKHQVWWNLMALIQGIDLAVGLIYTLGFEVAIHSSAFPMFNAAVFLILLLVWRPKKEKIGSANPRITSASAQT
jgi:hypothetical protein